MHREDHCCDQILLFDQKQKANQMKKWFNLLTSINTQYCYNSELDKRVIVSLEFRV